MLKLIVTERQIRIIIFTVLAGYSLFMFFGDIAIFGGMLKFNEIEAKIFGSYQTFEIGLKFVTSLTIFIAAAQMLRRNKNITLYKISLVFLVLTTITDWMRLYQFAYDRGIVHRFVDIIGVPSVMKIIIFALITIYVSARYGKNN